MLLRSEQITAGWPDPPKREEVYCKHVIVNPRVFVVAAKTPQGISPRDRIDRILDVITSELWPKLRATRDLPNRPVPGGNSTTP